jgi:anti-anti-sigma regulatory factor
MWWYVGKLPIQGEGGTLYGIELRESGTGMMIELWGEFDLFSLRDLREALNEVSTHRRPTLVDLSGITFLDLQSAREFAVRSLLYARHLTFGNPSAEVLASLKALGLEGWIRIEPYAGQDGPPVFSEVS